MVDYPWVEAPAAISLFAQDVLIRFSGPVDRDSVEERLRTASPQVAVAWRSDTELVATFPYCSGANVTVAGALDAAGRELTPAHNPSLELRLPCHGSAYHFVRLSDPQVAIPGWPGGSAGVLDVEPESGLLLGRLGTILFLLDPATGEAKRLSTLQDSVVAGFLPGMRVAFFAGSEARILKLDGMVARGLSLGGTLVSGVIAPGGKEALLLTAVGAPAGPGVWKAVRVDLEAGTMKTLGSGNRPVDQMLPIWVEGAREVLFLPISPHLGQTDWSLHVDTGAVQDGTGSRSVPSPDGIWEAVGGAVYPAGGTTGEPVLRWAEPDEASELLPVWSANSRLLFTPTGEVVDLSAKMVVDQVEQTICGPHTPLNIWSAAPETYLAYVAPCH